MATGSEGLAGGESPAKAAIYSVELSMFEGPLDLLLHLVRRHELDILDIPISFVAEKYLEYLHLMRSLDLEVAGDYLVMAATLAWLKSRELLPPEPREGEAAGADDEEGEDPREALIRRLVEYERFKSAAAELDAMPVSGRDVFARGADIDVPPLDPGLAPVTLFRLAEAYYRVLTRAKINKTHDVTIEAVTVAQRMQQLTLMLDERQEFDFEGLFLSRTWGSEHELRSMLVVTLMSVLELVKLGVARVQQVPDTDAIRVYRLVASEEARKLIESYDEEQSFGAPVEPPGPAQPTEAELDALEERALLAEALAGLSGPEDDGPAQNLGELGALAEALDPETLVDPRAGEPGTDELGLLADEADLGPEAIAAAAANSDPTGPPAEESNEDAGLDLSAAPGPPDASDPGDEPSDAPSEAPGSLDATDANAGSDDLSEAPGSLDAADANAGSDDLSEAPGSLDAADADAGSDDLSEAPGSLDATDANDGPDDLFEAPGSPDADDGFDELSEAPGSLEAGDTSDEPPGDDVSDAPVALHTEDAGDGPSDDLPVASGSLDAGDTSDEPSGDDAFDAPVASHAEHAGDEPSGQDTSDDERLAAPVDRTVTPDAERLDEPSLVDTDGSPDPSAVDDRAKDEGSTTTPGSPGNIGPTTDDAPPSPPETPVSPGESDEVTDEVVAHDDPTDLSEAPASTDEREETP